MIMSSASSPPSMMTPESDVGSPLSASPSLRSYDARSIIRQLLETYSKEEINRLVEEESCTNPSVHGHLTEAAFCQPFLGSDRESMPSQSAPMNHGVLGHQNYTPKLGRSLSSNASSTQRSRRQSVAERGAGVATTTPRLDYACGFCAEENIRKTCTRRNDLRRHIENFHNSNAVWFCQHPGCKMAYDWQTAYQNHLRTAHGRSHMNIDEAKIKMCPQTMFACGFENCTQVFEAPSEDDTAATLKEYSSHIVKHFEEGSNSGRWTYSSRIRNLLRQRHVSASWDKAWPELERPQLQWEPQSSMAARKTLEAGHLENLPFLIRFLIMLGSNPEDLSKFEGKLEAPFRERCTTAQFQHRLSHDANAQSPQHILERDMNQFKVSGDVGIEYRTYSNMQPGHHVPRSIEPPFNADRTIMDPSRTQGQAQFNNDRAAGLQPLTPPHLFFANTGPGMYSQSSQMMSTGMPPHQQPTEQYIAVGQESSTASDPVVSPVGFHAMAQVASISGSMDIEMAHDSAHTPSAGISSDRRGNWIGSYSQMSNMQHSIPTASYDMSHAVTPEHGQSHSHNLNHMAGRYGSPAGSL